MVNDIVNVTTTETKEFPAIQRFSKKSSWPVQKLSLVPNLF